MREHRVVWKREGSRRKFKVFARLKTAQKLIRLLTSAEPWREWCADGSVYFCCSGYMDGGERCPCEGATIAEEALRSRAAMPTLEYVRLETRTVSDWEKSKSDEVTP